MSLVKLILKSKNIQNDLAPEITTLELRYPTEIHKEVLGSGIFNISHKLNSNHRGPEITLRKSVNEITDNSLNYNDVFNICSIDKTKNEVILVVTSTNWDSLFDIDSVDICNKSYELSVLIHLMKTTLTETKAQELTNGQWHLPYVTDIEKEKYPVPFQKALSIYRCTIDINKDTYYLLSPDKILHVVNKILENKHLTHTTLLHQAKANSYIFSDEYKSNFENWLQLQKIKYLLDKNSMESKLEPIFLNFISPRICSAGSMIIRVNDVLCY